MTEHLDYITRLTHRRTITGAVDLDALCAALNHAEQDCDEFTRLDDVVDLTELPVYGGDALDAEGVFSWDAERILTVGDYGTRADGGWCIVPRSEWDHA